MLSFDFGGRIRRRALRRDVEVGTSTLSVRNCWWQFDGPSGSSIDSDQLNDGLAADMDRRLAGVVMARCRIQDRHLILDFSGDHRLQIDLNNRYEAADDDIIAELKLKGGVLLMLSHDGRFLLDAEASRSALQSAA